MPSAPRAVRPAGIAAALSLGAQAVQLGRAFMACPEAQLHPVHREALRSPSALRTRVTRAYSGRAARGIVNRLMEAVDAHPGEILPYPWQSAAIRDIRAAANAQARPEFQQLWAGQGAPLIRPLPVSVLMEALVRETDAGLQSLGAASPPSDPDGDPSGER